MGEELRSCAVNAKIWMCAFGCAGISVGMTDENIIHVERLPSGKKEGIFVSTESRLNVRISLFNHYLRFRAGSREIIAPGNLSLLESSLTLRIGSFVIQRKNSSSGIVQLQRIDQCSKLNFASLKKK